MNITWLHDMHVLNARIRLAKWPFKALRQANSTVATKPCQPLTDDIEMIHFGGTEIYENWKISQLPHQEVCWQTTINERAETLVLYQDANSHVTLPSRQLARKITLSYDQC